MKTFYTLTLLILFTFSVSAAENNEYIFFDEGLSISLSTEFKQLSSSELNKRYSKQSVPPAYAFKNKDQSVTFTFTQYETPAHKKEMNKIHKSISNMLRKANAKSKWKKDKVYTRLGTKIAVYEYETKSVGKYQYNLTYALPVNEKLTFISFVTTDNKYKKKWLALAQEGLESIKLDNK